MVKSETIVNHNFQEKTASSTLSQSKSSSSTPKLLSLSNEIDLKNWHFADVDSTDPHLNGNNNNILQDVHYVHELPQADEERLEKLFKQLDRNNNGKIDVHDLSAALKEFGLSSQYAEVS